jgi:hypothetical protein
MLVYFSELFHQMSHSYREDSNDAKAVRRGIVEPRSVGGSQSHAKKPFHISGSFAFWNVRVLSKYATLKDAEKALAAYQKKGLYSNLTLEGPGIDGKPK